MRVLDPAGPQQLAFQQALVDGAYWELGQAAVLLSRSLTKEAAASPVTSYSLAGQLYLSKSGWLLLSVPNALVRGAFDAMQESGIELPPSKNGNFNAHISVVRPEELVQIGGAAKVTERGHQFHYTLGPLREVEPAGWPEMSKCWMIEVQSPALKALRNSYGLSPLPKGFEFHISVAVRRKSVTRANDISKGGDIGRSQTWQKAASVRDLLRKWAASTDGVDDTDEDPDDAQPDDAPDDNDAGLGGSMADDFAADREEQYEKDAFDLQPVWNKLTTGASNAWGGLKQRWENMNPDTKTNLAIAGGLGTIGAGLDAASGAASVPAGYRWEAAKRGLFTGAMGGLGSFATMEANKQFSGNNQHAGLAAVPGVLGAHAISDAIGDSVDPLRNAIFGWPSWELRPDQLRTAMRRQGLHTHVPPVRHEDDDDDDQQPQQPGQPQVIQKAAAELLQKIANGDMLAFQAWKATGLSDEEADRKSGESLALPGDERGPEDEYCPHCDARLERGDDGDCNRCGEPWPEKEAAAASDLRAKIDAAAAECETPTEEQKKAGNYKKGHCVLHSLPITIETGRGMTRSGTSPDGKKWSTKMNAHYGYIKQTESDADGDHIDVFIGPEPDGHMVFVIDQVDPKTGKFDEHKAVLGTRTKLDAEKLYLSCYEKGWQGIGGIRSMHLNDFKRWLDSGDTGAPIVGQPLKKAASALTDPPLDAGVQDDVAWEAHDALAALNKSQNGVIPTGFQWLCRADNAATTGTKTAEFSCTKFSECLDCAPLPMSSSETAPTGKENGKNSADFSVLSLLRSAKTESDRGNYKAKHMLLRLALRRHPDEFAEDSREGNIVGLTHTSGFKIHAPAKTVGNLLKIAAGLGGPGITGAKPAVAGGLGGAGGTAGSSSLKPPAAAPYDFSSGSQNNAALGPVKPPVPEGPRSLAQGIAQGNWTMKHAPRSPFAPGQPQGPNPHYDPLAFRVVGSAAGGAGVAAGIAGATAVPWAAKRYVANNLDATSYYDASLQQYNLIPQSLGHVWRTLVLDKPSERISRPDPQRELLRRALGLQPNHGGEPYFVEAGQTQGHPRLAFNPNNPIKGINFDRTGDLNANYRQGVNYLAEHGRQQPPGLGTFSGPFNHYTTTVDPASRTMKVQDLWDFAANGDEHIDPRRALLQSLLPGGGPVIEQSFDMSGPQPRLIPDPRIQQAGN